MYGDNMYVFVKLEDKSEYIVIVGTTTKFLTLINQHGIDFLKPSDSFIIVRKLTIEVIEKSIHAHTQDNAYWLKLHHFSGFIKNDMFNKL